MIEKSLNPQSREAEFVAFRAGSLEFCINIMSVREIRGWTPATAIPRAPSYIRGVINLRGVVLPIVDLGVRLGLPVTEPTARHVIIVAQVGERAAGLLVDSVSDILSVEDTSIQPTPDVASQLARMFVRGVIAMDGLNNFLAKPFTTATLKAAIEAVVGKLV
jgi:purine-binding chemotaxis protein CheW